VDDSRWTVQLPPTSRVRQEDSAAIAAVCLVLALAILGVGMTGGCW